MNTRLALVIEDNQDLATIFREALRSSGFQVEIASTGESALEQLAATVPSVITLDLHLPQANGGEILRHIRADARLAGARVILTTADPAMAEMLQDEADLVLIKPISFTQLRDLAARLILMG